MRILLLTLLIQLLLSDFSCAQEKGKQNWKENLSLILFLGGTKNKQKNYDTYQITEIFGSYVDNEDPEIFGLSVNYTTRHKIGVSLEFNKVNYITITNIILDYPSEYNFEEEYKNYYVYDKLHNFPEYKLYQINILGGFNYNISIKKLAFQPGIKIGINHFIFPSQDIFLKEKGSNYSKLIRFEGQTTNNFITTGGLITKYQLLPYLGFQLNIFYSVMDVKIKYNIETIDFFGDINTYSQKTNYINQKVFVTLGVVINFKSLESFLELWNF